MFQNTKDGRFFHVSFNDTPDHLGRVFFTDAILALLNPQTAPESRETGLASLPPGVGDWIAREEWHKRVDPLIKDFEEKIMERNATIAMLTIELDEKKEIIRRLTA